MLEQHRPRIAWFTPLRPVQSGISLYNEELLPILATVWQIDVYVDQTQVTHLESGETVWIRPAREFVKAHKQQPYDAIVYQMGNNPAHGYMYQLALEYPGLLVLHDTLLHHLIISVLLFQHRVRDYRSLMERHYGAAGREMATRVLKGQTPLSLFQYPLSEDLVESARAVAVHSRYSQHEVAKRHPGAKVHHIPMGIRLPREIPKDLARRLLGLPEDQFVLASVTHVNPYKRLNVVLRAVRRLAQDHSVRFLVAGSTSPEVPLDRMVSLLGLEELVEMRGFVDDLEARLMVAAADVCVNLRYPTAGETSASLLRMMGMGRPVLVSDAGSFSELPDDTAVKVPVDVLEEETVYELLYNLARVPALTREIGLNARAFVDREHSLAVMAAAYHRALENMTSRTLPSPPDVEVLEEFALPDDDVCTPVDPLVASIADAVVDLGVGGDEILLATTAQTVAQLGLGKMWPSDGDQNDTGDDL